MSESLKLLAVLAAGWAAGMVQGWRDKRREDPEGNPLSWRILLGPVVYERWLKRKRCQHNRGTAG